ncbi:transporter substrate-binding domain-containing protein [Paucibacter sp. AS339]|uniref:substrate-binding periplasmic protein n=1 Tax=Paucibacter hankyongi TaxID=3133434 RepID=UPI0030B67AC7
MGAGGLALAGVHPGARAQPPAALRLVTGDLPPFAAGPPADRPGVLVELAEELLRRIGQPTKTEFFPWARALLLSSSQPRILVLPLTRTPEREAKYQWLVKLYVQHFVFINRADQARITQLEQARRLRISVLRGAPSAAQLLRAGFSEEQLVWAGSVEETLRQLERGHADAIFASEEITLDMVRVSGRKTADFQVGLMLESGEIWLAAGGGVTELEQQRLRDVHRAMRADGSIERLFKSYDIKLRHEDLR